MKNLQGLLKNKPIKKILLFFSENPHSIDTAKGISVWVGCELNEAQKALNSLVKKGILLNHKTASTDAYSYTNDKDIVKHVEKHIKKIKRSKMA